jgi:phosphate uptake regulator
MHIIVNGMNEDTIRALQNKDKNLAQDVLSRDDDVDRLHWLIARQYNIILQNVSLAGKMNITIGMTSTCFLISKIIERIGDHIVRISQNIPNLVDSDLNKQTMDCLLSASNLSLDIFNKSMGAFFKKDIKTSNETMESVAKLELLCEEINAIALKQKGIVAIHVGYVVESIRRIGEYAEDISENVINYLVTE